jgi:hypothetical protein
LADTSETDAPLITLGWSITEDALSWSKYLPPVPPFCRVSVPHQEWSGARPQTCSDLPAGEFADKNNRRSYVVCSLFDWTRSGLCDHVIGRTLDLPLSDKNMAIFGQSDPP